MAQPKIDFNIGEGGLGRPLAGEDHFSAFLFYSDTLPTGFATDDRIKKVASLEQAESLGIVEGGTYDVFHYHIEEFFRLQPKGVLFIGFYTETANAFDFVEITTIQNFAEGKIRQIGVYVNGRALGTADVQAIQTVLDANTALDQPLEALLASDISGTADLTTLPDLRALTPAGKQVSVVVGQDGSGRGSALATTLGYSVCAVGSALGSVSKSLVSHNIGWVQENQLSDGTELDVASFGNGDNYRNLTSTVTDGIHDKGYIFLRKLNGLTGTYWNDACTSVAITSDFAYIENNRTINKARRDLRTALLNKLNSPITVDPTTGFLSEDVLTSFNADARGALDAMQAKGEISAYAVIIDPEQDVLSTSEIVLTVKIVPVGVARTITVNLGFTVNV